MDVALVVSAPNGEPAIPKVAIVYADLTIANGVLDGLRRVVVVAPARRNRGDQNPLAVALLVLGERRDHRCSPRVHLGSSFI